MTKEIIGGLGEEDVEIVINEYKWLDGLLIRIYADMDDALEYGDTGKKAARAKELAREQFISHIQRIEREARVDELKKLRKQPSYYIRNAVDSRLQELNKANEA